MRRFSLISGEYLSTGLIALLAFLIPMTTTGVTVVLVFFIFFWFLSHLFQEDFREQIDKIRAEPILYALFIFLGVFVVASFYSQAPWIDIKKALFKMGKWIFLPILVLSLRQSKNRSWVLDAFLGSMILTLFLGTLKFYSRFSLGTRPFTAACVFKDHIFTNLMMSFTVFMLAHKAYQTTFFWKRMVFLLLCGAAIYYVLFLSNGRSGYVMLGILWVLFFIQRQKGRYRIIGIASLAALMFLAFYFSSFQGRVLQVFYNVPMMNHKVHLDSGPAKKNVSNRYNDISIQERLLYVKNTWTLIKIHPWFGFGTGSLKTAYKQYFSEEVSNNKKMITENPHNEYLNIALQCGLLGLCVLFWFFYCLYKQIQILKKPEHYYAQGLLLMMMIGCMGNSWLMDFTSGYFFMVCLAACLAAPTQKKYEKTL